MGNQKKADLKLAAMQAVLIDCNEAEHADAIREIFNEAIAQSTALYEYEPRSPARISQWFADKLANQYPVIGLQDNENQQALMGFATYGPFRPFPAFQYSMEHSIYIHPNYRGQGIGRLLLETIIERARAQQVHVLVGGIDADNIASIRLHERLGFEHAGTIKQSGYKFGRWLDLSFYQKIL